MRLIIRFILVVLALAVVAVATLLLLPGEKIANLAATQFEARTGRSIEFSGEVRASIYPLLGVKTGPVVVANAPWSDSGPMLRAEGLSIGVDLLALLTGDVQIKKIEAIAPQIVLERANDGRANWEMAFGGDAADDTGSIPAFSLERGLIRNATLTFQDHATGEKITLNNLDATLRLPDFDGRGDLSLSAQMNGQPVTLKADIATFGRLLTDDISQMSVAATIGGNRISFDGRAGISPPVADGVLEADLADMTALFTALDIQAPDLPVGMGRSAKISGKLTYTPERTAHLRDGRIALEHNLLTGAVDLFLTDRMRLKAQLSAGALDFSALAGEDTDSGAGWSKQPIDVSGLRALDADVTLTANSVDLGTVKLGRSRIQMRLDNARAVFELQEVQAYAGIISGQFVVNGRSGLSVGGTLAARAVEMAPLLLDLADYERLVAKGDMDIQFLGVGRSMDAIMHSLSGNGALNLGQGEILGLDLVGMLRNLDTSYQGGGQKTRFDSLDATFAIKDGVLSNDDLLFIAPQAKAQGKGKVGIGARTLDYRINPVALAAEDGSGGISVPVLITGTWANPKFRPDLAALVDQNLADEKAAIEARIKAEKAAAAQRAKEAASQKLGVETEEGESLEDSLRRKLEEEAGKGLLDLLGGN